MKFRSDFVTNSSSSSFVIARHKEYSKKDFDKLIADNDKLIRKILEVKTDSNREWLIEEIEYEIRFASADLTIGDWDIICGRASNDNDGIEYFLYECSTEDTEHFKMRRSY